MVCHIGMEPCFRHSLPRQYFDLVVRNSNGQSTGGYHLSKVSTRVDRYRPILEAPVSSSISTEQHFWHRHWKYDCSWRASSPAKSSFFLGRDSTRFQVGLYKIHVLLYISMYEIDWKVTHIYMAFRNWSLHWNQLHSAWWTAMASTVSQIPSLLSLLLSALLT